MIWQSGALLISAWLGSFGGIMIAGTLMRLTGEIDESVWEAIPSLLAVATVFVFPITIVGLILIGIPLGLALRPYADRWWMWLVSPTLGGLLGGVGYLLLAGTLWGAWDLPLHHGIAVGATTGFLFFASFRRGTRVPQEN